MCAAFLLNALLLCLGPVWAHATQPGPALLLGRLLGPHNHLTLVAHLEQSPGQRHTVTCLEVAEASPTFKYAFPVEAQLLPLHLFAQDAGNCTENIYIRNIIEIWDGTPEALCDTASLLLSNSSFADIRRKKCTGESDSSSPWVYMLGELGGEPSAAWLQFLPQGMSGPSGRADQSVPPEKTSLLRDRRSDGDLQELQSCIYEHRDAALGPNQGGEIILVIGTTGVGKSTLVSFVTDSDDSLNSVENSPGNFLIEDSSHKIGSGISSKTSVPELVTDKRTNFNVYDFPGFSDTRGSCSDIVTASVLQMVARSASSIKVVLVVPFDSVRSGSDRLGFVSLLRHATAFIKKPLKYQSSVGLVVTKVPNVQRKVKGVRMLVSDNDMRRTVVSFLREVNGTLDTLKQSKSDPEEFYPAASQLISNILEKEGDEYPRIGLFRTPEEEGLLSELQPMQEAKSALQNLFYNVLTPTVPDDDDFGLPLSDVAKFSVQRLHSNFASRLEGHVAKIGLALKEHYRVRRQQLLDIAAVREQSSRDRQHLAQALNRLLPGDNTNSSVSTPREFLRRLLAAVREVHQGAPAVDFLASLNDTAVLELLEDATPEEMQNLRPEQWSQPLQDLMSYVDGVELWYRTLDTLETALSAYEVQGDKDLKRRIRQKHESRGNKELNPLFPVLTAVNGGNFDSFDLAKLEPDAEMLRDLDLLVNATLYPEPLQSNCVQERSGWSLKIRGTYIWMSDVLKEVRAGCEQHISAVHILAEHSLFIDADLYLNNEESKVRSPALLYIFSPRWQVLGDHTLSVDGLPGALRGPPPEYSPGSDGLAGLPGGAGGSIVALGDEVLDGHRLQLSASGGAGGRGQDGTAGLEGANGFDATKTSGYPTTAKWNFGLPPLFGSVRSFTGGGDGGCGHDGGAGGVGGHGGQAGSIRLLPINATSTENRPTLQVTVKTRQTQGRRGAAGRGGAGGQPGTDGATLEYTAHFFLFIPYTQKKIDLHPGQKHNKGKDGRDGTSTIGLTSPEEPVHDPCVVPNFLSIQKHLLESLWDRVKAGRARYILEMLDVQSLAEEKACYDVALVKHIAAMEELRAQRHQENCTTDILLPRYEASLKLLHEILKRKMICKEPLLAARTAVLTSLRAMRSPAGAELVVNVKNFLVASSRTVRQFADSKEKINVMENIGEIRLGIAKKIGKRRDLLSNQIQPAIAIAVLRLQRAARELPAELIEEQQRVNLSKRLIDDQHRKIREAAFRGKALGLLSTLVKACIGMFSTDTVILDGALEAVTVDMGGPVMLPGTDTGGDQIKTMFTAAKSLMSIMSDDDDHFDPEKVFSKIQSIATAVSASHLQNGDSESSGLVDEMVPTSRPSAATVNHRSEMKKGLASDVSATATLAIQEHYLIRREEWLRVMEHAVRNGILPLLDSFQQDMQNVFSGPERSRAALSLRSGLGEVRLALAPLTVAHGGLAAPRELQLCAELLDESLGVLVSLLDEIEEYREQLATAASVQSLKSRMVSWDIDFCTGDGENKEELKEGVAVLEKAIRANLVLERHNMAMHSYKQWAFPFASEYLNRTSPSMEERTVRNGDGAAISASTDINELLERLERNHAVITNRDSKIFTRYFKYPDSLHLWAHDQYEEHLDQLLEGKEVTMLANVLESPLHEDAVKFDTIDVRLVSTNESRQSELDLAFEESQISMTHLGVSYYKCGSQVFSVSVESQDISFSAKKKDGKPLTTNGVYDKLRDGDMMLSPYAVWKIKIDGPPSLFRVLSSFKGEVSLALEGHAQYVHGLQCSNSLRGYYKAVESKSELNVMAI